MSNHEQKIHNENVHLYLAFRRNKVNEDDEGNRCFRQIIKDEKIDLDVLRFRCNLAGGVWRIHHTVNTRSTKKAMKLLQHKLIDTPENASFIDSLWRTCLLQVEARAERKFMIDVDTKDPQFIKQVKEYVLSMFDNKSEVSINGYSFSLYEKRILKEIETPNGYHIITDPFDRGKFCNNFPDCEVLIDGYYFVCEVGKENTDETT